MFYKLENDFWFTGSIINLPNGQQLTPENKLDTNGWEWYDSEPVEYTQWLEEQHNDELENNLI